MRSLDVCYKPRGIGLQLALIGAAALTALAPQPTAADQARQLAYGRHLAQECTGCHRLDGIDNGIPSIVGWDTKTLRQTMEFYQTGSRTNPTMVSVARSLDEEQLAAVAAYFATLPKPTPRDKSTASR